MVVEEYLVLIKGPMGNNQSQFTYWVDPHKKPNIKSVLRDFKLKSHIQNVQEWKLCTLGGGEIRFLADYADRILVLKPRISTCKDQALRLPSLVTRRDVSPFSESRRSRHLSQSYTTLPSLVSSSATSQSDEATYASTLGSVRTNLHIKRSQSMDGDNAITTYDQSDKMGRVGRRRRRRKKMSSQESILDNNTEQSIDDQPSTDKLISNNRRSDNDNVNRTANNNNNNNNNNGVAIKQPKRKTKV